jgi:hypothetical protein
MIDLFTPGPTVALGTGPASTRVALGAAGGTVRVLNPNAALVFLRFGDESVTASLADMPVAQGAVEVFDPGPATHAAAVTASGDARLYLTSGRGA